MAKRSTIGNSPLDAVVPKAEPTPAPEETPKPAAPAKPRQAKPKPAAKAAAKPEAPARTEKERLTVHVPVELINRLKNAVYWTPGLTLAGLAEEAFDRALEGLEKDQGGPFPQRDQELRGGRPLK